MTNGILHTGVPREHPIRQLLDVAASGHAPSTSDLDAIAALAENPGQGKVLRRSVAIAAEVIVGMRRDGNHADARRKAAASTAELTGTLPEWQPPEQGLPDDPRELAARARGEGPDADAVRETVSNIQR